MAKTDKINFTTPSGFSEFLPGEKRLEQYLLDTIRKVYESYGFTPIETPAVERLEVLQAKGNQGDNIIYGISPILPPNRQAEKQGIPLCVIIGKDEAAANKAAVKDLRTREQIEVSFDNLAEEIKRRLN